MGIASRLIRLCKADLHGVMDQMEDRALLLKQHLREMETALAARKAQIDQLRSRMTRAARDLDGYKERKGVIEEDLALAVARDKDDIARMLIRKKYPLAQRVAELEARLARWGAEIASLEETVARQETAHEALCRQAAAVEDSRSTGMAPPFHVSGTAGQSSGPSEEEIELELLQCKEAQQTGRLS